MRDISIFSLFFFMGASVLSAEGDPAAEDRLSLLRGGEVVEIIRDERGVSRVDAATYEDVWFGQGYAAARERLWPMDLLRRDARGELAEIGAWRLTDELSRRDVVRHDRIARLLRSNDEELSRWTDWLERDVVLAVEAYAEGVNRFIETARADGRLPAAYATLDIEPRPWSAADTLAICELLEWRLGHQYRPGYWRLAARDHLVRTLPEESGDGGNEGWLVFNDLFSLRQPGAPSTAPFSPSHRPYGVPDRIDAAFQIVDVGQFDLSVLEEADRVLREESRAAEVLGLPAHWGDAAWALGPERTRSGRAMLLAGVLMGPTPPAVLHEIHLNGPSEPAADAPPLNVRGAAFAGMPAVYVGANARAAWAPTSGIGKVSDFFVERLDERKPDRYYHEGRWAGMIEQSEVVRIRNDDGGFDEERFVVSHSVHGPILSADADAAQAVALKTSWWKSWSRCFLQPLLALNRMETDSDFTRACRLFSGAHHVLYADVEGNIAYQWTGLFPNFEREQDPRIPALGNGRDEWNGLLSFRDLASSTNPSRQYLINWNNKPDPDWPDWQSMIHPGAPAFEALERNDAWTREESIRLLEEAARDDFIARFLRPAAQRVQAMDLSGDAATLGPALERMLAYEARLGTDPAASLLYDRWFQMMLEGAFGELLPMFFEADDPQLLFESFGGALSRLLYYSGEERYLRSRTLREMNVSALMRSTLDLSVETLTAEQGPDMNAWRRPADGSADPARWLPQRGMLGAYLHIAELADGVNGASVLAPEIGADESGARFGLKPFDLPPPERP